ncbi:MAG TPA: DUF4147 domain-containing protein [Candidatus Nanoarchaeia archaeon]|nr:DUF4147 domain-containing protein [Candidatus Nanoarchaeia archaeon]
MIIKNYSQIASAPLKRDALDILLAGVNSVMPQTALPKKVAFNNGILKICGDELNISKGKIYVIGFGKASAAMASALEKIIPKEHITAGIVNCSTNSIKTEKIKINMASHPVPDERGVNGTKRMLDIAKKARKGDTVIFLISGGGSALLPDPAEGITLKDLKRMTEMMIKSGAKSYELNNLRKHTSMLKGGNFARTLQPARVISLILSDVINPNDVTASGPTCPDNSTFRQSYEILKKHKLWKKVPQSVTRHIKKGMQGKIPETVKPNEKFLGNVHNYTIADYRTALEAMGEKAAELGFDTEILPEHTEGEVKNVAAKMSKIFKRKQKLQKGKFAFIYSSENTVTVKGKGKGGRNQEYIAYLINEIKNLSNCVAASIDSDGIDFLPGVGGAIADNSTYSKSQKLRLDIGAFIKNNNSFDLHKILNTLILTKPTNTNVGDINVYLQGK